MANNNHDGEPWPYHEDPNGNMVPCASNPCKLHGGSDVIANSREEATAIQHENKQSWGMKKTSKKSKRSKEPRKATTEEIVKQQYDLIAKLKSGEIKPDEFEDRFRELSELENKSEKLGYNGDSDFIVEEQKVPEPYDIHEAKPSESDDRAIIAAYDYYDPNFEGGSYDADMVYKHAMASMPTPMHADDGMKKATYGRILKTSYNPHEDIKKYGLEGYMPDGIWLQSHRSQRPSEEDIRKAEDILHFTNVKTGSQNSKHFDASESKITLKRTEYDTGTGYQISMNGLTTNDVDNAISILNANKTDRSPSAAYPSLIIANGLTYKKIAGEHEGRTVKPMVSDETVMSMARHMDYEAGGNEDLTKQLVQVALDKQAYPDQGTRYELAKSMITGNAHISDEDTAKLLDPSNYDRSNAYYSETLAYAINHGRIDGETAVKYATSDANKYQLPALNAVYDSKDYAPELREQARQKLADTIRRSTSASLRIDAVKRGIFTGAEADAIIDNEPDVDNINDLLASEHINAVSKARLAARAEKMRAVMDKVHNLKSKPSKMKRLQSDDPEVRAAALIQLAKDHELTPANLKALKAKSDPAGIVRSAIERVSNPYFR